MGKGVSSNEQEEHLTHAQIWDDSSLVQSWNEAAAEYKRYHSIHARGEDMDALLERYENGSLGNDLGLTATEDIGLAAEQTVDDEEDKLEADGKRSVRVREGARVAEVGGGHDDMTKSKPNADPLSTATPAPADILLTVPAGSNEDLRALMMSWYYAGYYTGLQEGKRQSDSHSRR
ncbi:hypothetical protein KEM54_001078 [Ascosphaera aggregata]|nr:hypothetical protein KEM54_001078 [Ascosphaera aggregata]